MKIIDASGIYYKDLNEMIKEEIKKGEKEIYLKNVNGQRYIGDGISANAKIIIEGTPGNDMAAFMDGLTIEVKGNGQDAIGNTMNDGKVIVHGHAGDVIGYAMRGGTIYIRDSVGYRVGIHMKEYMDKVPVIVVGGSAGDFFGEYMAGGILILLGLNTDRDIVGDFCGTGMHGGVMYIRGDVEDYKLGKEVKKMPLDDKDMIIISKYVEEYAKLFNVDFYEIMKEDFIKLYPYNKRPYGRLYTH
ncbi:Glutamate synthase domain-containing protein 3 [Caldanaerobius fijiensis DSM 17918]|uniref:Glutamate synthase domain-containing protein 3 n=1 Tax=Caldanaerobius fijiensis DSM 17918 TaxID=1121256 RepID=A0A1M4VNI1_9THEO|nr:hypothetical protein [Caldanaerobius fijiensis]SHE70400.1 Glutamate synthase domain-containing protein 3 [Caldanaerobius fijiensis DSM 17918]